MSYFRIWWEQITGPMKFLNAIKRRIDEDETCTFLFVPDRDKLPWDKELRETLIGDHIPDSRKFNIFDDAAIGNGISEFLLERFATKEQLLKCNLRPVDAAVDDFLIQNGILDDKIIWVKNISDIKKWKKHLFPKYNKKTSGNSVIFILETDDCSIADDKEAGVIKYPDCVSEYDIHLFASLVAAESRNEPELRRYITFVAENLCGFNVKTLVSFISDNNFKSMNIVETFTNRYKTEDDDWRKIERRLWRAQLQAAFPVIEEERTKFVNKYFEVLWTFVPDLEGVEEPYDIELGKLVFLLGTRELIIEDRQERDRVYLLQQLRNKLAHLKYCDAGEMYELLSGSKVK